MTELARLWQTYADDPAAFRNALVIDSIPPVQLGTVIEPWQDSDFRAMDPAWLQLTRSSGASVPRKAYFERPRGHSKTADQAISAAWALSFSRRRLFAVAAAADKDQARLLRDAIDKLVALNPWLHIQIDVQKNRVINPITQSQLDIISADTSTSWGLLCDFIIVDELTVWSDSGETLFESLYSTSGKRQGCIFLVISNAGTGMGTSWQWKKREAARQNPAEWIFSSLDGPQAKWITQKTLDDQRSMLHPTTFQRVWLNRWTTGSGDALDPGDIRAALESGIDQLDAGEPGWSYGAGLDLGLKKDSAAFVIVGKEQATGRYRLARVWAWKPSASRSVNLADVENTIVQAYGRFRWSTGYADPWQGAYLLDRLKATSVPFESWQFSPQNLDEAARHVLNLFTQKNLAMYYDEDLVIDLNQTKVEERNNGKLYLEWPSDSRGHGDRATALMLGLLATREALPPFSGIFNPASEKDMQQMIEESRRKFMEWSAGPK